MSNDECRMSNPNAPSLPPGVRLTRSDDGRSFELVISAADADELAWRIHDLIPLIQTGELSQLLAAAAGVKGEPAKAPTPSKSAGK
jgi:hypothetical protein